MKPEQAKTLREEFPSDVIGKLPRAANKAAADRNQKGNCPECGKYHVLPAIHLDYVGHAAVTDRLLKVDPEWSWEPMARDETGAPVLVTAGSLPGEPFGLWIWLTVADVRTPGFGGGKNVKEAISDAIRNAAMRRGVALDLWAKEDLHAAEVVEEPPPPPVKPGEIDELHEELLRLAKELEVDEGELSGQIQRAMERRSDPEKAVWYRSQIETARTALKNRAGQEVAS